MECGTDMSKKIAVVTDSNSGITQKQAQEMGLYVLPMPFMINNETYFEAVSYTHLTLPTISSV